MSASSLLYRLPISIAHSVGLKFSYQGILASVLKDEIGTLVSALQTNKLQDSAQQMTRQFLESCSELKVNRFSWEYLFQSLNPLGAQELFKSYSASCCHVLLLALGFSALVLRHSSDRRRNPQQHFMSGFLHVPRLCFPSPDLICPPTSNS